MDISTLKSRPLNLLEERSDSVVRRRLHDASTVQVFEIYRQGDGETSLRWGGELHEGEMGRCCQPGRGGGQVQVEREFTRGVWR